VAAETISTTERQWAALMRDDARARLFHLLREGAVLCMPTTPFPAPHKGLSISGQTRVRDRITCLCAHGGLTGVCQVTVPVAQVDGLPVGLSIVAAPGTDAQLVSPSVALSAELSGTIADSHGED
jgi:amidase